MDSRCIKCDRLLTEIVGIKNGEFYRTICRLCKGTLVECGYCKKLCTRQFKRSFCSLKCRLLGQIKKQNDCWIWIGNINQGGYGYMEISSKTKLAHRVSFGFFKQEPNPNLFIIHSCHNRSCINPDHLREGTVKDNAKDCVNANHHTKGESVGTSKLKAIDVKEIRRLHDEGYSQTELADIYDVHQTTIGFIVRKVTWKHIK